MFGIDIRRTALAATLVATTGLLGACIAMPGLPGNPGNPGGPGGPGFIGAPPVDPQPQVQTRTFNDPQVGGRWLDLCYAHGACRQQQQIDTFCQQQGYDNAVSSYSRNTVVLQTNVRLGDQSVCRSAGVGNCHRVASVTCQRTV